MGLGFFRPKLFVVLALMPITIALGASEPTIGGIALEKSVHVRCRAGSVQLMISRTKPVIVWGDTNMIWIDRDKSGRTLFAVNRAYQLDTADKRGSWALFEADADYAADGFVDYTRQVTPGTVLSTDRRQGSVYLVEWTSRHSTGAGPIDSARHIFLLKTREGEWKFIGEGLGSTDARSDNKQTKT